MDAQWAKNLYEPTIRLRANEAVPRDVDFEEYAKNVQAVTEILKTFPRDPVLWLLRCQMLVCLKFPELAVGDAHKARVLIRIGLGESSDRDNSVKENTRLEFASGMIFSYSRRQQFGPSTTMQYSEAWHGFWDLSVSDPASFIDHNLGSLERAAVSFLIISLQHCNATFDLLSLCKEASRKYGGGSDTNCFWSDRFVRELEMRLSVKSAFCKREYPDEATATDVLRSGNILCRRYPWMGENFFDRSADALSQSMKLSDESKGRCEIQASDVAYDALGVFALQDIAAGDEVLTSHSLMTATASTERCPTCCRPNSVGTPFALECCQEVYCGEACAEAAKKGFHPPLCKKDLSCLAGDENQDLLEGRTYVGNRLFCRVLAICVQYLLGNTILRHKTPLTAHPLMNQLRANYEGPPHRFNFRTDITIPLELLERMGVDVFADHRFDTWVLRTLQHRIENNQAAGYPNATASERAGGTAPPFIYLQGVFPSHAFVNHSCAPNGDAVDHGSLGSKKIMATRDISEGEEITISYAAVDGLDVEERRRVMMPWLGAACQCSLCIRERGE